MVRVNFRFQYYKVFLEKRYLWGLLITQETANPFVKVTEIQRDANQLDLVAQQK